MRPSRSVLLSCALLGLSVGLSAVETDWPWWRGPERDGSVAPSGEAIVMDAKAATHLWASEAVMPAGASDGDHGKTGLSGGCATPAYSDGRLYLYYQIGDPDLVDDERLARVQEKHSSDYPNDYFLRAYCSLVADDILIAIDEATGRTLWRSVWERTSLTCYKGPWSTPCVADGRVFTVGNAGLLVALDAASGEPLWHRQMLTGRMIETRYETDQSLLTGEQHRDGPISAPAVIGGVLVCGNGAGGMTAYDPATGELRWRSGGYNTRAPLMGWRTGGQALLIAGGNCFDPADGSKLWSVPRCRSVAVSGDLLVCHDIRDKQMVAYRIDAAGAKEIWRLPKAHVTWRDDEPVFYQGRLYIPCCEPGKETSRKAEDYHVICVDPASGEILAKAPSPVVLRSYVGLYAGEGRIFYSGALPVAMWNADPADFRPLGVFEPAQTFCVGPLIIDGRLFYRGFSHIQAFDLRQQSVQPTVPADPGGLQSRYQTERLRAGSAAGTGELVEAAAGAWPSAGTAARLLRDRARGWSTIRDLARAAGATDEEIRLRQPSVDGDTARELGPAIAAAVAADRLGHAQRLCSILAAIPELAAEDAEGALEALTSLADPGLPAYRAVACAQALGASGHVAAVPALRRLIGHKDPIAAGAAGEALGHCAGDSTDGLAALAELLSAADRRALLAVRGLVHLAQAGRQGPALAQAVRSALASPQMSVRAWALMVVPSLAERDPSLIEAAIHSCFTPRKPDSAVGRLYSLGSGYLERIGKSARPAIEAALADDAWLQRCDDREWTTKELQKILKKL